MGPFGRQGETPTRYSHSGVGRYFFCDGCDTRPSCLYAPAFCSWLSGRRTRNGFGHYCHPIRFDSNIVLAGCDRIDVAHQNQLVLVNAVTVPSESKFPVTTYRELRSR